MELDHQRLRNQAMVEGLSDLGTEDTPQHNPYKDASQNGETFPNLEDELELTFKWGQYYS